jgi:hypothetical protein
MVVTNEAGSYTGSLAELSVTPIIGWGDNSSGQLQIPPAASSAVALASGGDHNLALTANGTVVAWGDNTYNQNLLPGFANPVVAIAEGDTYSLALETDGTLVFWGTNFSQCQIPATGQSMGLISAGSVHSLSALGSPRQQTVLAGGSTTLSAAAFANQFATFQWECNGVDIPGATNSTLTLSDLAWTESGIYRAIISYPMGSIETPAMSVTVPALKFDSFRLSYMATNGLSMRVTGSSGQYPVVIYATTNLVDWTPVYTNSATTNAIIFTDGMSNRNQYRFYRAVEPP